MVGKGLIITTKSVCSHSMPHKDLLEGAIILEEFVKEIAAVLFARKTTALLTLPQL